jgi:hypothetical protein
MNGAVPSLVLLLLLLLLLPPMCMWPWLCPPCAWSLLLLLLLPMPPSPDTTTLACRYSRPEDRVTAKVTSALLLLGAVHVACCVTSTSPKLKRRPPLEGGEKPAACQVCTRGGCVAVARARTRAHCPRTRPLWRSASPCMAAVRLSGVRAVGSSESVRAVQSQWLLQNQTALHRAERRDTTQTQPRCYLPPVDPVTGRAVSVYVSPGE